MKTWCLYRVVRNEIPGKYIERGAGWISTKSQSSPSVDVKNSGGKVNGLG